jgi:hypothetical protein
MKMKTLTPSLMVIFEGNHDTCERIFHPVWLIVVTIVFCITLASQRKPGRLLYTFSILCSVLLAFRIPDLPSPENTSALEFLWR